MMNDFNISTGITLNLDASAAKGIAQRIGLGKLRHLEVSQLWLQNKVASGDIVVKKLKGADNIAEAMTKFLSGPDIDRMCSMGGLRRSDDRHPSALRA